MEKKVEIKEIVGPNIKVEVNGQGFELLCEYQSKDGGFERVYVQEDGKDVIIENSNGSAIVGLFSVEYNKVKQLFDYIEAKIVKDDGFVCWQSGSMEHHLLAAVENEGKYPFISSGIGEESRVPLLYRQRPLDEELHKLVEEHTTQSMFVRDSVDFDVDETIFFDELDEVFDVPPKLTQAGLLPEGWKWVDYPDLSGHLEAPDGKQWFQYDVHHDAYVEFKRDDDSLWSSYPGRFEDFKLGAEKAILEHVLKNIGGLKRMGEMKYYVIDDKMNNFSIEYFDGVAAAHARFMEVKADVKKFSALGVQVGDGSLDLLHGVNGDAVLVTDYRDATFNFSEPMKEKICDIEKAARWLVLEGGGVSYEYQNDIVPAWMQGEVTVLVPVTLGEKAPSSYCDDKLLKATISEGFDAIDSLYMENHGWVAYDELLRHSKEYVADGTIKVQYLNVNYVLEKNVVGIDGQMDISPCEYKEMVAKINKPYQLSAYDGTKYTGCFRDKHEFIVGSFDTAAEAVKGWYEVQERKRVPLLVESHVPGEDRVVFNGFDENDKRMSFEDAAKKFGFADESLDSRLLDAAERAGKPAVIDNERDLEI